MIVQNLPGRSLQLPRQIGCGFEPWQTRMLVCLSLGAIAIWQISQPQSFEQMRSPIAPSQVSRNRLEPKVPPPRIRTAQVYWLNGKDNKIALVGTVLKLPNAGSSNAAIRVALETLLLGIAAKDTVTSIPQGTRLLGLAVTPAEISIDLSHEFLSDRSTVTLATRIAQVVYTATEGNPTAKVRLAIAGKSIETIDGMGLTMQQPLTRAYFEQHFAL